MKKNTGKKILSFIRKIFVFNRSLTGDGNRKTLNEVKKITKKLKIIEYKSGKKVFDWTIPPEWNVKDAFVKFNDKKIIDFKKNNLHLLGYSCPIKKKISLNILKKHLYTDKENKKAIPYVTSYYKKNWGFCVSQKFKNHLKKGIYDVNINSSYKKSGNLTIGEIRIKGKSKKEIILSTNICHPSMANHETSGISVTTFISKFLLKRINNFSYRILFVPETVGMISYLKKNIKILKKNFFAGFHLTCLGGKKEFSMVATKYQNSYSDFIAKLILKKKINKKIYSFNYAGSDERQFNYPGINLPVVTLTRELFAKFKEYHTSEDNLKKLKARELEKSFQYVKEIILLIEKNFYEIKKNKFNYITKLPKHLRTIKSKSNNLKFNPKIKSLTICEPFMSKRNLYRSISKKKLSKSEKILFGILYYADNIKLSDINIYLNKKPKDIISMAKFLKKNSLIKFN
jgi:aminopeptidase-like protein